MSEYATRHPGECNTGFNGGCSFCHMFNTRPAVRAAWGGDPSAREIPPAVVESRVGCTCDRVQVGGPYLAGRDCGHCWHWHHTPAIRKARGGDPAKCVPVTGKIVPLAPAAPFVAQPLPVRSPCRHEGAVVESCLSCGNQEGRHVRQCLHPVADRDRCTRDQVGPNVQACSSCPDYETEPAQKGSSRPVGRRHLAYHILPVTGNGVWQRGVDQLRLRWELFTGRKVVSIATGGPVKSQASGRPEMLGLDPPEVVRRYLPPDAEVIEVANSETWELASWSHLWSRVLDGAADDDVVLYAHAKGVTRPTLISTANYDGTPQHWAAALYTLCLDYWPHIDEHFRRGKSIVCPMLRDGRFFLGENTPGMKDSRWHPSGNFVWVRAEGFRRFAQTPVPQCAWGVEAWWGIVCPIDQAGNVGPDVPQSDNYSVEWWNREMIPKLAAWVAANPTRRPVYHAALKQSPTDSYRLSVIVPTQGRPSLQRTLESITTQLAHGDEVLVERDESGDWGAAARTRAIARASGDYLLFMDDDDVYLPGALDKVRAALRAAPRRPHLFQMRYSSGRVLWDRQEIADGVVSTVQFCCPNDSFKFGVWGSRYQGDFDFIRTTCEHYADGPVWVPEVICDVRPGHPNGSDLPIP